MKKLITLTLMFTLSLALAGCYESSSEATAPAAIEPPPVGVVANGATYYETRCAICHKVGKDDITTVFGAVELAQKQDMIATDMSNYDKTSGFNLMLVLNNVPAQRVADLKAYLKSVPN